MLLATERLFAASGACSVAVEHQHGTCTIIAATDRFLADTGLARDSVVGQNVAEVIRDGAAAIEQAMRGGGARGFRVSCGNPLRTWSASVQPLGDGAAVVNLLPAEPAPTVLAEVLDQLDMGVVVVNDDFRVVAINDRGVAIDGRPREEILGRQPDELWPALVGTSVQAAYANVQSGRQSVSLEYHHRNETDEMWLDVRISPIGGGTVISFANITHRKQSDERQEFRLALLDKLRDLADPHAIVREGSRLLGEHLDVARVGYCDMVDDQHAEVAGFWSDGTMPSLAGRWRLDLFGPEVVQPLRRGDVVLIADVDNDPRVTSEDVRRMYQAVNVRSMLNVPVLKRSQLAGIFFVHHSHSRVWSEADVRLVGETGQRITEMAERARVQAALRSSEARSQQQLQELEAIYRNAPVGLWLGDRERRFTRVNEVMAEINGVPVEQHIGRPIAEWCLRFTP